MARKATASSTAVAPAPARERIVQALMRLASDRPWNDIEIADIAEEAQRHARPSSATTSPRRARCSAPSRA